MLLKHSLFSLILGFITNFLAAQPGRTIITKTDGPFLFRYEFNPAGVEVPLYKNSYAKRLSITELKTNTQLFQEIIFGNLVSETAQCRDSLQTSDYDFDGYPDIRICKNYPAAGHYYIVFDPVNKTFGKDSLLNSYQDIYFDHTKKQFTGTSIETGFGKTLIEAWMSHITETWQRQNGKLNLVERTQLFKQDQGTGVGPLHITKERKINGLLLNVDHEQYGPVEYEDYNFDGYTDYRKKNPADTSSYFYFLFDTSTQKFVYHELLSQLKSIFFDPSGKIFKGIIFTKTSELSSETRTYSWVNGRLEVVALLKMSTPSASSETVITEHYELIDGKLVLVNKTIIR